MSTSTTTPTIPPPPDHVTRPIYDLRKAWGSAPANATEEVLDVLDVIYLDLQNITGREPSDALVIAALGAVLQLQREG